MTSNCWLPLERIGEQKADAFCEAVNCERYEQEGKFLFCDAGFSPWFHLRVPAQFSQPCMATSGLVKRGERWYHFTTEVNFLSKVYSKGCMTGSPLSCNSHEEMISYQQNGTLVTIG